MRPTMKYQLFVLRSVVNDLKSPVTKINFYYGEIIRECCIIYYFVNKIYINTTSDIKISSPFPLLSLPSPVKATLMMFFDPVKYS